MGSQPPPLKGAQPPIFGSWLLWPNGWMDEDATWYESRPRPRPHCIRRGPNSARKGHSSPRLFGPCLLWPRSRISATAELLLGQCTLYNIRQLASYRCCPLLSHFEYIDPGPEHDLGCPFSLSKLPLHVYGSAPPSNTWSDKAM